jgi:diguanylate cyclase (GGDEF)-like protein
MLSLHHALVSQHARRLMPVCCAEQTITQLHHYFEDVVLENHLSALVVERLPFAADRKMREVARLRELVGTSRQLFLCVNEQDALAKISLLNKKRAPILVLPPACQDSSREQFEERFVIIAADNFSALLASVQRPRANNADSLTGDEVIWSFEPDVVYSGLEYLMARLGIESPSHAKALTQAVRQSMPKATSPQLTLSITTKLARLLQEQAVREVAVNRIAAALRSSGELSGILQTAINELGRALGTSSAALIVEPGAGEELSSYCYFRDGEPEEIAREELIADLKGYRGRFLHRPTNHIIDGHEQMNKGGATLPMIAVPLIFQERVLGALLVRSADMRRAWHESEVCLLQTVADQLAVALNNARLLAQTQHLALTDALTGCYNRRAFEQQLERDMHLAQRVGHPVSLVIIDVDHFKRINDTYGHDAGDEALRVVARVLRQAMRKESTTARLGGEEFAVILPQVPLTGAIIVAERLRERLASEEIPRIGHLTASFGVATYPMHANTREELVTAADRALYQAKNAGRNRVCAAEAVLNETVSNDDDAPPEREDNMSSADGSNAPSDAEMHTKFIQFLSPNI